MFPPDEYNTGTQSIPVERFVNYCHITKELIRKRPEFKDSLASSDNKAHKFILRVQHWANKGYTEKVAIDKAEEEMAKNLQEIKTHSGMQLAIGSSGSIRNFYDHYQAVAEYEGRLKVKRLDHDLADYQRSLSGVSIFDGKEYINDWSNFRGSVKTPFSKNEKLDNLQKIQNLVKVHEDKVNKYDGLSGLSDNVMMYSATDAYKEIQSASRKLAKALKSLGVKMQDSKSIDVSKVKNPELRESLKNNKLVGLIFKNAFENKPVALEKIPETKGPKPPKGPLEPRPIIYRSENPYEQVYSRIPKNLYESQEDRINRLKRIWNNNQKRGWTQGDQIEIQSRAVEALRSVRLKVDQLLVSNKKPPVFPPNSEISQEDLLLTHKFDIKKISKYLDKDYDIATAKFYEEIKSESESAEEFFDIAHSLIQNDDEYGVLSPDDLNHAKLKKKKATNVDDKNKRDERVPDKFEENEKIADGDFDSKVEANGKKKENAVDESGDDFSGASLERNNEKDTIDVNVVSDKDYNKLAEIFEINAMIQSDENYEEIEPRNLFGNKRSDFYIVNDIEHLFEFDLPDKEDEESKKKLYSDQSEDEVGEDDKAAQEQFSKFKEANQIKDKQSKEHQNYTETELSQDDLEGIFDLDPSVLKSFEKDIAFDEASSNSDEMDDSSAGEEYVSINPDFGSIGGDDESANFEVAHFMGDDSGSDIAENEEALRLKNEYELKYRGRRRSNIEDSEDRDESDQ